MSIWGSFSRSRESKKEYEKSGLPGGVKLALLAVLTLFCALSGLCLGSTVIDLPAALSGVLSGDLASAQSRILLYVRLPRVIASLLSGAALSVSGMLLQAVLSNPLAAPNVIGVNAGAGRLTIILSGVAVSSIFTAGINTVKTFCPDTLYNGSAFLIGGFSGVSLRDLSPAWAVILLALGLSLGLSPQADLLGLGETPARSLGMNVSLTRLALILLSCVLAGCAVSFSGLLGFVGLLAPHIVRRLFKESKTSHRLLIPAAALLGAGFVTLCDLLSRLLFAPYELPVGILLSFVGGPFFLYLLIRERRRVL